MPISPEVKLKEGVKILYPDLVNLYGCTLGKNVRIGPFVEIQKGVVIGDNTKVGSHSFICEGVRIGKDVLIAHGVMFINDLFSDSEPMKDGVHNWKMSKTKVGDMVRVGSNATILPARIGEGAIIGAGSVVTKDVSPWTVVAGNPARVLRRLKRSK